MHVLGAQRRARRSIEDEEIISRENALCFMLYGVAIFYDNSLDDVGVSILVVNVLRKPRRTRVIIIIIIIPVQLSECRDVRSASPTFR